MKTAFARQGEALPMTIAADARWHMTLTNEVLQGLLDAPRKLSGTLIYDPEGLRLFEAAKQTEAYYIARTEAKLIRDHAKDILLGEMGRATLRNRMVSQAEPSRDGRL